MFTNNLVVTGLKTGLRRIGLNVTRFPAPHMISRHIKDFLKDNQINLVLDVGAFHGEYCKMLRKDVAYTGMIVSFEPCHESFQILSAEMAKDRQWQGYSFGLSDRDSVAILNTFGERGDFNSLLRLREEGGRAYKIDTGKASTEAIQLQTIDTIWDDIAKRIHAPRVFLKIDTQGHDTAVLLGAVDHLQYIYGVQSELPAVEIYDGMASMVEALSLYQKLGYVPIGFYPVNKPDAYGGLAPEFDVILKQHG